MQPDFVGDYRIIELVGEGSFGKVMMRADCLGQRGVHLPPPLVGCSPPPPPPAQAAACDPTVAFSSLPRLTYPSLPTLPP